MINTTFLFIGSVLPFAWGTAHLFPTKSVVKGFGELSADNRNIITMEWILEGVSLIYIGILVFVVTLIDPSSRVSTAVYWTIFGCLNVFSAISLFTGFRVNFIFFKFCPVIFTGSSILIILGILL